MLAKSTPHEEFLPVQQVLENALSIDNGTSRYLKTDENVSRLTGILKRAGFIKLSPIVKHGTRALVFEANDRQMLRITHETVSEKRLCTPEVLQPLKTISEGDYKIEVLPKVNMLDEIIEDPDLSNKFGLSKKDIPTVISQIFRSLPNNIIFRDLGPENIGIIRYHDINVPLIVDAGAAIKKPMPWIGKRIPSLDQHMPEFYDFSETHKSVFGRRGKVKQFIAAQRAKGTLDFPFAVAQDEYVKALGLHYGMCIATTSPDAVPAVEPSEMKFRERYQVGIDKLRSR